MDSPMSPYSTDSPSPNLPQQMLVEHIWQFVMNQLCQGTNEVVLPTNIRPVIGPDGMNTIVQRYCAFIKGPAVIVEDTTTEVIKIRQLVVSPVPTTQGAQSSSPTKTSPATSSVLASNQSKIDDTKPRDNKSKLASKQEKVPRPPNAFILYRQHHHPIVKAANPGMHNNEISIILGSQWKNESPTAKAHFNSIAESLKRQHSKDHPQYQYQPRKPSEKKRRMTRRKAAVLAGASVSSTTASDNSISSNVSSLPVSSPGALDPSVDTTFLDTDDNFQFDVPIAIPDFEEAPSGELLLTLPTDELVFAQMIENFNNTLATAPAQDPMLMGDSALPLSFPTDVSLDDNDHYFNLIDWSQLERNNEEVRERLEVAFDAQHSTYTAAPESTQQALDAAWDREQGIFAGAETSRMHDVFDFSSFL
ncbi:MAG: hypothetical protein M1827_007368 [Pycnora praestabilis]|nr:MAG: hypothetical protein M1827_007368 [Pycnora praestabilis]